MPAKTNGRPAGPRFPGWAALTVLILLGASHLVAGVWLGRKGTLAMAVLAEMIWLALRPWQWDGATASDRRFLGLAGAVALGLFAIIAALLWRWPADS